MDTPESELSFIGITIETVLRPCEIYAVGVPLGHGYVWEWCAIDADSKSKRTFELFFDCLEDARHNGYEPHFLQRETADMTVVPVSITG